MRDAASATIAVILTLIMWTIPHRFGPWTYRTHSYQSAAGWRDFLLRLSKLLVLAFAIIAFAYTAWLVSPSGHANAWLTATLLTGIAAVSIRVGLVESPEMRRARELRTQSEPFVPRKPGRVESAVRNFLRL